MSAIQAVTRQFASVDGNGNIVATGIGDTVITISTSDGKTKNSECECKVSCNGG